MNLSERSSDLSSGSSDGKYWVEEFLEARGHEYFCNVDEDFILDRFNLTGLNAEVEWYPQALDVILDRADTHTINDEITRTRLERAASTLYGLIHARFILTARGMQKMADKYRRHEFGTCPRVLCGGAPVLPVGLDDVLGKSKVKLYCPKCQDIYTPKLARHANLDGAFWSTTFPHLMLSSHPMAIPADHRPADHPMNKVGLPEHPLETYTPKIFGFRIHAVASRQRARQKLRELVERAPEPGKPTTAVNASAAAGAVSAAYLAGEFDMAVDPALQA
ncbi:casein kinase 2 regulatory subunit [Allomyces javanicus]|nr:casein kinase 2 regulatory subunit [Allomyces javanicus]